MLLWRSIYKYLFEFLLSISLDIYLEVELPDHLIILFSFSISFSRVAPPDIPSSSTQGLLFIHILTKFYYFLFLIFYIFILIGWNWYFAVTLICIFLMINVPQVPSLLGVVLSIGMSVELTGHMLILAISIHVFPMGDPTYNWTSSLVVMIAGHTSAKTTRGLWGRCF